MRLWLRTHTPMCSHMRTPFGNDRIAASARAHTHTHTHTHTDTHTHTCVPMRRWVVVDTPGMGDVTSRLAGESDKKFEERQRARRRDFFKAITHELHDNGGVVIYVLGSTRLHDSLADHMRALKEVL